MYFGPACKNAGPAERSFELLGEGRRAKTTTTDAAERGDSRGGGNAAAYDNGDDNGEDGSYNEGDKKLRKQKRPPTRTAPM